MESVYPAGMLDRDQRTAKIRLCQCRCSDMEVPNRTNSFTTDASTKISSIFSSIVFNKKRTKFSYLIWKKGYLIHTYNFPRVKNVVLVLVYLTLTMMNPASTAPAHDEVQEDKWWEKPCGSVEPSDPLPTSPPEIFFKWHLSDLLVQAEYNLIQANHLKDSFAFYTVGNIYGKSKKLDKKYEWLELQPHQPTEFEIYAFHMGKEVMKDVYRCLQMTALAFDIITNEDEEVAKYFLEEKPRLRSLLCGMESHFRDRNIKPPFIDAELIEKLIGSKQISSQEKDLRNYMVYTNYTEALTFLADYLRFFEQIASEVEKLEKIPPEDEEAREARVMKEISKS
ncbi:uncharacterized protein [Diabrotica undecimpunctata]|uniref:uncharacterized protein isoform X2 n=1 Tax=Diabrotica undecimpunctata TaxID=50387 RepID=UPI003B63CD58